MRVLILGGDGYLGWPTAMDFAARGHEVAVVDNYLRRQIAMETRSEALVPTPNLNERAELFEALSGKHVAVHIGDCVDAEFLSNLFRDFVPDTVVHYAEQPSGPYSMIGRREAALTLHNNLTSTFNVVWAILEHAPNCHIIKIGTMGEYGTPKIDIEEGWIEIEHKGRKDKFLFPRAAGSLYHTTKVLDTDLLYFYVRLYGIRVTDLMQARAEEKDLLFSVQIEEGVPPVRANPEHVKQIWTNLVSNAIKYTAPGGIVVVSLSLNPNYVVGIVHCYSRKQGVAYASASARRFRRLRWHDMRNLVSSPVVYEPIGLNSHQHTSQCCDECNVACHEMTTEAVYGRFACPRVVSVVDRKCTGVSLHHGLWHHRVR